MFGLSDTRVTRSVRCADAYCHNYYNNAKEISDTFVGCADKFLIENRAYGREFKTKSIFAYARIPAFWRAATATVAIAVAVATAGCCSKSTGKRRNLILSVYRLSIHFSRRIKRHYLHKPDELFAMSNRLIVARERSTARQHACDPSHARHSINNSIIVLDWITFWAKKNKKTSRGGKSAECDARGETQREAVITRNGPCIYQIISVLYRPIDREKKLSTVKFRIFTTHQ